MEDPLFFVEDAPRRVGGLVLAVAHRFAADSVGALGQGCEVVKVKLERAVKCSKVGEAGHLVLCTYSCTYVLVPVY